MENIINKQLNEIELYLKKSEEQPFRAKQIFEWIYKKNVLDFNLMTNLPKELKHKLDTNFFIKIPNIIHCIYSEEDNSYKFILQTEDKQEIESLLMLKKDRVTLCISCMIGCPLKCKFCATGSELKYLRNLETSEIIGQVLAIQKYIQENIIANKITNIVFMGMGEPLLNYENTEKSITLLLDKNAFGLSKNRITLSTAGIINGLSNLINKYQIKLAVSLHFPEEEQRSKFMPINRKYPLSVLLKELKKIKLQKRDYITIEYLMLNNINDSIEHAKKLVKLLSSLKVKINLIPYNPTQTFKTEASSEEKINKFAKYLASKNLTVTVRRSHGKKIKGGCGQFILNKN